jgi:hypothetical protein
VARRASYGGARGGGRGDVGPGPPSTLEPALGEQLFVGLLGHRSAHAEVRGEGATARQAVAPGEGAVDEEVADPSRELDTERAGGGAVEADGKGGHEIVLYEIVLYEIVRYGIVWYEIVPYGTIL